MFDNCILLTSLNLSNFNTTNTTDKSYIVNICNSLIFRLLKIINNNYYSLLFLILIIKNNIIYYLTI